MGSFVTVGVGSIKNPHCCDLEYHTWVKICGILPKAGEVYMSEVE